MKLRHLLLVLFAAFTVLAACQEKEPDLSFPSIAVSQSKAEVDKPSSSFTVQLTANRAWRATSNVSWIAIDPDSGKASDKPQEVVITVQDNASFNRDGKVIFDKPIPQELFDRFVHRMDEMDVSYGIDNPIKCITKDMDDPVFIDWRETFSIGRDVYRPIEEGIPTVGYKVSLLYRDLSQIEQLKKEFPELTFDVLRTYKCTDVAQKGIDKGTAAMAIIDYFSIPYENTYAFGDGENDYSMLKAVCHGVCMGKHAPCLEEVCETITECVQDEGVANALKRFGLID